MLLSPLNGLALPTRAANAPVCAEVTATAAPPVVQPLSVPVSKPLLTIGSSLGGGGGGGGGGRAGEGVAVRAGRDRVVRDRRVAAARFAGATCRPRARAGTDAVAVGHRRDREDLGVGGGDLARERHTAVARGNRVGD